MLKFKLVQFDSYGAKSSCVKVVTNDIRMVIDPGVAIMHPSFPASIDDKVRWLEEGRLRIYSSLQDADIIIITHYHYDHFIPDDPTIYGERLASFLKNPNVYINDSQRERAKVFLEALSNYYDLEISYTVEKRFVNIYDPGKNLRSLEIDFGDYNKRRRELINRGRAWFRKRLSNWKEWKYINEVICEKLRIIYPENSIYRFGDTKLIFTPPLFHGIEYSRVGWVYSVLIVEGENKLFYSSDLNGPIIEDYADIIIKYQPNIIILDGPMTYMLGYTLNRINLSRCLENVKRIIDNVDFDVMIWDHHLPREKRFRERTAEVWEYAYKKDKLLLTAREYSFNKPPLIEEL